MLQSSKLIISLLIVAIMYGNTYRFYTFQTDTATVDSTKKDEKKKEREGLPLEPGRTLSFKANEGSWISLDVSPDGKTLVFDLLGDLYTMPSTGGTATQITHGMSFDAQPRFSPDGKHVVFVSDSSGADNVWLYDMKEKEVKALTKGANNSYFSPEWTPDGKYIVVSKGTGLFASARLAIIHKDGGSGTQLISKPNQLKTMGAAFGKDPRYIWYARRTGDWQYNAVMPQYQIARYDRETGRSETMTSRYGSAMRPTLSPDGKYLVYATRYEQETGLRIRTLATGDEKWLAYPVQRDDQEARSTLDAFPGYSFTPDSKSIVVSYGGKIWKINTNGNSVTEIPFTANVNMSIGPEVRFDYKMDDDAQFTVRQIRRPAISPDGKKVAFTAMDKLWVMDLKEQKPERLTETNDIGEHYPTWSPDGRWIAFTSWADNKGGHIYKVRSKGGDPEQLTRIAALYTQTAWSPDGNRIVAVKAAARDLKESIGFFGGGLAREIIYVSEDGGATRLITKAEGRSNPHFTTDRNRVYMYSGAKGLHSMRWDGTDERSHVKVTGIQLPGAQRPANADFILMAPKGDQALVQIVNHLYTVTVPYTGGSVPSISINSPDNAAFPARKLTEIGGEFPSWNKDANKVFWSIGNALNMYDLVKEKAFKDSVKLAEKKRKADEKAAKSDTTLAKKLKLEKEKEKKDKDKKKKYKADVLRITIKVNRDKPNGTAVLSGARVITMKGKEIIENADIVIKGNRIHAIGRSGSVQIPSGAERIDVSGKTIIPGFVDTHYHPQWLIPDMHTTQAWQFLTNLGYGVTTSRDPQTATTDILTYSDMVDAGHMIGPRTYSTGPGVFWAEPPKNLKHAKNILRRYSDYYDTKTFKMYMSGNRKQRQYLIMAAKELELMPTTEGGLDYKLNLTHAIDGYSGLEHSMPVTPLYNDVVQLFVKSQITYSPTLLVSYGGPFGENYYYTNENVYEDTKLRGLTPYKELASKTLRRNGFSGWFHKDEYVFKKHASFLKDLIPAGGRAGVGSHGQLQGLGYHWELWSVQSGGLSTHDALRMATIYGAEGIGFGKDVGSLEVGKFADLLILSKNPLDDIRNSNTIEKVMKNGRLYNGNTLDELWPRQKKLPKQYWQESAPKTKAGIK